MLQKEKSIKRDVDYSKFRKYRKKPVVVEAYQTDKEIEIKTQRGTMKADISDWIIKGITNELYPCKADIFDKTYEPVKQAETNNKFKLFRKIPVIIEAYQSDEELIIDTLEGSMRANIGDYIIKGVEGELYPCKAEIFYETYEEVGDLDG